MKKQITNRILSSVFAVGISLSSFVSFVPKCYAVAQTPSAPSVSTGFSVTPSHDPNETRRLNEWFPQKFAEILAQYYFRCASNQQITLSEILAYRTLSVGGYDSGRTYDQKEEIRLAVYNNCTPEDYTGMSLFQNVTHARFIRCGLQDISCFAGMPNLVSLDVSKNRKLFFRNIYDALSTPGSFSALRELIVSYEDADSGPIDRFLFGLEKFVMIEKPERKQLKELAASRGIKLTLLSTQYMTWARAFHH